MSKESVKDFFDRYKRSTGKMMHDLPNMMKGFKGLFDNIMHNSALDLKTKELIALAIGLAVRCEPCIYLHTQKCLDAGATREEILEAASVTVMMQGGPSFTHIPAVIEALDALEK